MEMKALKRAVGRTPFRPFTVHIEDGTRIPVRHPEAVVVIFDDMVGFQTPAGEYYLVGPEGVTAIRVDPNGKLRRRRNPHP